MSKYEPLWNYLKNTRQDVYKLSFDDINKILGFKIDHSFLSYKKELEKFGYRVIKISMKEHYVLFQKEKI